MIVGVEVNDELIRSEVVLKEARETGFFKGIELGIWEIVLSNRDVVEPTISQIFGMAYRREVLQKHLPYYVSIDAVWAKVRGTLMHTGYEHIQLPPHVEIINEKRYEANVDGVQVSGKIDRFYPGAGLLIDVKTTLKGMDRLPDPTHIGQITGYRWLLEENGLVVAKGQILYLTPYKAWWEEVSWWEDDTFFEALHTGVDILHEGFVNRVVPSLSFCRADWCRYCAVRRFCRESPEGFFELK